MDWSWLWVNYEQAKFPDVGIRFEHKRRGKALIHAAFNPSISKLSDGCLISIPLPSMDRGKRSWWGAHVMRTEAAQVAPLLMQPA